MQNAIYAIMGSMSPVSDPKIVFTRATLEDSTQILEWIRKYYTYDHTHAFDLELESVEERS